MRTIVKLVIKKELTSKDGNDYTLYTYQLDDGSVVDTLQECELGEQVMLWYDDKWHKAKIKKRGYDGKNRNHRE